MELLATMTDAFEKEEIRCKDMIHLANMFECPTDIAASTDLLGAAGG